MTEEEVIERLRTACANAGGQKQFAKLHGFTPGYVSDVLSGKRGPADRILATLGLERVVVYRKKRSVE
jgi:DNA-binding transcriptional regulator YdaS (Cro superfamily)